MASKVATPAVKPIRHDTKQGRYYEVTGVKYPSVTTILSVLGKDALIGWAAKTERDFVFEAARQVYSELVAIDNEEVWMGEQLRMPPTDVFDMKMAEKLNVVKAHTKLLKEAAAIGTNVHARIEWQFKFLLGLSQKDAPELVSEEAVRSYSHFETWLDEVSLEPLHVELPVWSTLFGYAGTIDLIARVDTPEGRKTAIIDFKTGKRIYREALLQNVAYRMAATERGIQNDLGLIVRLPKEVTDPSFEVGQVPSLDKLAHIFLALIPVQRWAAA